MTEVTEFVGNHRKTLWRTALVDRVTGRPLSRFKRRRLERTPEGRAKLAQFERERRQLAEASAVAKDAKERVARAGRGE